MKELFLTSWQFNAYLIIKELEKEIKKQEGYKVESWPFIKTTGQKTKIHNRTYENNLQELKIKLEEAQKSNNKKAIEKAIEYYKNYYNNTLEAQKRKYKSTRIVKNANYITFYLKGYIYYIELKENPFFEHYVMKEKAEEVKEGLQVKYNHYIDSNKLELNINNYAFINDKNIKKIAKNILEQVLKMRESEVVKCKKRVYNTYNNGSHFESVLEEKTHNIYKMEV